MREKAKAKLREVVPATRGNEDARFTQPSLCLLSEVCTLKFILLCKRYRESHPAAPAGRMGKVTQPFIANFAIQCTKAFNF